MKKLQFIFEGGLGNQLFQYFASKYIHKNIQNIELSYALSNHILDGYRNFELNKLLKEPIKISKGFNQIDEKIYSKIFKHLPFLTNLQKLQLTARIDLLNGLYYEKNYEHSENSLPNLIKILHSLNRKIYNLKIKGFWQNPNSYLNNLDYYKNLIIDTKQIVSNRFLPEKYITIHIRRGDYLTNKRLFKTYYSKFSPVEFTLLALNLIPKESENMPIYLISDDQNWANYLSKLLSAKTKNRFFTIETKDHLEDWAILRHSSINICSNSTFSYTAALLNYDNLDQKLRCIIPQWFSKDISTYEKGWLKPKGFIDI